MSQGMERTPLSVEEAETFNEAESSKKAGMTAAADACWQVWQ